MAMGHGHSDPAVTCLYYNIWKDLIVVFFFQYKIDWKYVPKYLKPKYCWYGKAVLICVTTHDRRILAHWLDTKNIDFYRSFRLIYKKDKYRT